MPLVRAVVVMISGLVGLVGVIVRLGLGVRSAVLVVWIGLVIIATALIVVTHIISNGCCYSYYIK